MLNWRKTGVALLGTWLALSGCGNKANDKTPEELLSLSISGLAALDRYAFHGTTGILTADGAETDRIEFRGEVVDHDRIRIRSEGGEGEEELAANHPMRLLKTIEDHAAKTELLPSASGQRTALLRIELESAEAARQWKERLNEAFERAAGKGGAAGRGDNMLTARDDGREAAREREMAAEIARSRKQFDGMLRTLKAEAAYELVVDRKRLVPMKLRERTVLRYEARGKPQLEERRGEMLVVPQR